jgi:hypothetical protein
VDAPAWDHDAARPSTFLLRAPSNNALTLTILKLRALHSSGDWDEYWPFHQQQEALRNYPKMPAAA